MTKKDFIALADAIRRHNNGHYNTQWELDDVQIRMLADFCQTRNSQFDRERWLGYIAANNGPSGGSL